MVTITITNPLNKAPKSRELDYTITARTWLLLAGFLPLSDNPSETNYINPLTGDEASIYSRSVIHV